eukprot:1030337_1
MAKITMPIHHHNTSNIRKRDTIRHNDDKRIETKYDAIRKANKDKKSSESPLVVGMEVLYNHSLAFVGTKKKLKCEVDWSIFLSIYNHNRTAKIVPGDVTDEVVVKTVSIDHIKPYYRTFEKRENGLAAPAEIAVNYMAIASKKGVEKDTQRHIYLMQALEHPQFRFQRL